MKPDKKKSDEAFIEKIKSLSINTGASKSKPAKPPTCDDCGGPMLPLPVAIAAAAAVTQFARGYRHPRKLPSDEQSFAA